MRTEDLHALLAIKEAGSLRKAAERLSLSQPSLTRVVSKLERRFGVRLLVRSPTGVKFTDAGEVALQHIRSLVNAEDEMISEVRSYSANQKVQLRMACSTGVTREKLLPVTARLASMHPELEVSIGEAGSIEIERLIVRGDIDLGLVARSPLLEPTDPLLCVRDLFRTCLVTCMPEGHPWSTGRRVVSLEDVLSQPLVLPSNDHLVPAILYRRFAEADVVVVCRTKDSATARHMVAEGLGITLCTKLSLDKSVHRNRLVALPLIPEQADVAISLIWRKDQSRRLTRSFGNLFELSRLFAA